MVKIWLMVCEITYLQRAGPVDAGPIRDPCQSIGASTLCWPASLYADCGCQGLAIPQTQEQVKSRPQRRSSFQPSWPLAVTTHQACAPEIVAAKSLKARSLLLITQAIRASWVIIIHASTRIFFGTSRLLKGTIVKYETVRTPSIWHR